MFRLSSPNMPCSQDVLPLKTLDINYNTLDLPLKTLDIDHNSLDLPLKHLTSNITV